MMPRPDQIDELTRHLQLPLPPINATYLEIIAEGINGAFNDLLLSNPACMASGSEAEVTALLEARLNVLISQANLFAQIVSLAVRGKETVSFDGSHIEKRPDISIYLTNQELNFPLVVEAKILDSATAKTVKLYCDKGLCRFLDGEYAWASQEAFMLAYVRDGSTIAGDLTPFLNNDMNQGSPQYAVEALPMPAGVLIGHLAKSLHARGFAYIHQAPPAHTPGSISIWHLWL